MNIFTYLKTDHQKVSHLFSQIVSSPESKNNSQKLKEIIEALTLHSEAEQASFYKAINKNSKGKEEVSQAKDEHKDIDNAILKIKEIPVNTPCWYIAFGELKATVEHHVHEEETEIFKTAKKILPQSKVEHLTEEMKELKAEIKEEIKKDEPPKKH